MLGHATVLQSELQVEKTQPKFALTCGLPCLTVLTTCFCLQPLGVCARNVSAFRLLLSILSFERLSHFTGPPGASHAFDETANSASMKTLQARLSLIGTSQEGITR